MLADENELLHTVAVSRVPVRREDRVFHQHLQQLVLRHSRVPLADVIERNLLSCLFEEIAFVILVTEVADTLGANHILWPLLCDEMVETVDVQRSAAIVHEGSDAVFFGLALLIVMMMVVMVFVLVMLVFVVVMVLVLLLVVVAAVVLLLVVFNVFFDGADPGGGSGDLLEVEEAGV